jgi:uncharacterized protein (DUF885 family)
MHTIPRYRPALIAALAIGTLVARPLPAHAQTSRDSALAVGVTALADRYVSAYVALFPIGAEFTGMTLARHDALDDNSLAALDRWHATEDSLRTALQGIDARSLTGTPAWATYGFLREALDASRAQRVCRSELWPVNQMSGWQATFVELADQQPVGTPASRADALARWAKVPAYIDVEIANLRAGVRAGYSAPKRLVELVIKQLDELVAAPPAQSPFYGPAARDSTTEFRAAWTGLLADGITPAARRYRDYLRDEYLAKARSNVAVTANPNGLACYRASFRSFTSIDRSPKETYALGERTVARYEREVRSMGGRLFGTTSLDSIQARLKSDPANHLRDRDAVLAAAREAVERGREATAKWFDPAPRTSVVVTPVPEFLERTASSSYSFAAEDGSRPATFRIVLFEPEKKLRSQIELLAAHETYPGHHVQVALAQEHRGAHPITRLVFTSAFAEGWARYSEALAEEMGLYSSDRTRIARRTWPAHGMVVDPGIHVFGWSRERALRYVLATGVMTPMGSEALIDRIIAWPGQLTSYDTGGLLIFALRERAQRELGPKFDIKRFHDAVLGHGTVTLPMLEQQVAEWIAREKR